MSIQHVIVKAYRKDTQVRELRALKRTLRRGTEEYDLVLDAIVKRKKDIKHELSKTIRVEMPTFQNPLGGIGKSQVCRTHDEHDRYKHKLPGMVNVDLLPEPLKHLANTETVNGEEYRIIREPISKLGDVKEVVKCSCGAKHTAFGEGVRENHMNFCKMRWI